MNFNGMKDLSIDLLNNARPVTERPDRNILLLIFDKDQSTKSVCK